MDGLRRYFYFAQDAADNFLERELGMKRGVSGGNIYPIHGFQTRKSKCLLILQNFGGVPI